MFPRFSVKNIKEALVDTPVVFVMGPRQVGKTTLVKTLIDDKWEYISFDDQAQLRIAKVDPVSYVRNLPFKRVVLDEVQRVPELFVSIKEAVDENRVPGKFLLTGSANAMLLPRISDSLVGRVEAVQLTTLSECEILDKEPTFLNKMLACDAPSTKDIRVRDHLLSRIVIGCFPEPLKRTSEQRSAVWYKQYVNTLIQRDVQELVQINYPETINKLLKLTAFYAGKLTNVSELGGKMGLDDTTVKKYIALLEQLFLVKHLPAWHSNEYKRLVKKPKMHSIDTGMICAIRGLTSERLLKQPEEYGLLLESFVFNELRKQANWIDEPVRFYHYRDSDKVEVDLIIENDIGDCFAVEVKAAATLSSKDFIGLKRFKQVAGSRFKFGVLLYDGDTTTPFGENLFAVPIGALWT